MPNPQKESGYTAIANEIMDALCRTRIPSEARQVLDTIFRNTYGWNRKDAKLSMGFIAKATGLKRPNVSRALKTLSDHNLITVISHDNTFINIWRFNKDFSKWKTFIYRQGVISHDNTLLSATITEGVISHDTQQSKDSKTKNNKSTPSPTAGYVDEVNLIFDVFYKSINPQITYARKDSRDAAAWLIQQYGFEVVLKGAQYACLISAEKYAPQIATPAQLKDKWYSLVNYKRRQDSTKKGPITI